MRRFLELGLAASAGLTLAFLAFSFGFERGWLLAFGPRGIEATNGSVDYFPAALALFAVGATLIACGHGRDLAARRRRAGQALLVAACAFVVSLAFRTVDIAFCGACPVGTHFVWHALNAVVLFILVAAAMRFRPPAA